MIKPPPLRPGDLIGVMAPSSRVDDAKIAAGVAALEKRGYQVYVHPQTGRKHGQSAGTAQEKVKALHDLFRKPEVKAIICAGGGNRAPAMMPLLDFRLIKKNPKIVMGYSDITALLHSIYKETGMVTFHGPMMRGIGAGQRAKKQLDQCFALLSGAKTGIPLGRVKLLRPGRAAGPMIGGNLSLITSLLGTPWEPDFNGKILFLEDCDEELSRYDRMLRQLAQAGAFQKAAAVLFGGFTNNKDTGSLPFGFTMEDIIRDALQGSKIPALMNAPFGHGKDLYTFPVGGEARLNAVKGKISLELAAACAKK